MNLLSILCPSLSSFISYTRTPVLQKNSMSTVTKGIGSFLLSLVLFSVASGDCIVRELGFFLAAGDVFGH